MPCALFCECREPLSDVVEENAEWFDELELRPPQTRCTFSAALFPRPNATGASDPVIDTAV